MLVYALVHQFRESVKEEKAFKRAMETAERLYAQEGMVDKRNDAKFQLWFIFLERAFAEQYSFRNPAALAAATSYMIEAAEKGETTKKGIAAKFGVSASTVSKYVDELSRFVPNFGN